MIAFLTKSGAAPIRLKRIIRLRSTQKRVEGSSSQRRTIGVSTKPGARALTRMPSLAWSIAAAFVRPITRAADPRAATRDKDHFQTPPLCLSWCAKLSLKKFWLSCRVPRPGITIVAIAAAGRPASGCAFGQVWYHAMRPRTSGACRVLSARWARIFTVGGEMEGKYSRCAPSFRAARKVTSVPAAYRGLFILSSGPRLPSARPD